MSCSPVSDAGYSEHDHLPAASLAGIGRHMQMCAAEDDRLVVAARLKQSSANDLRAALSGCPDNYPNE